MNRPEGFDRTQLDLATQGDAALAREVLGLFLKQAAQLAAKLAAGMSDADARIAVHALRGAALVIGARALAAAAASLEAEYAALAAGEKAGRDAQTARAQREFVAALDKARSEIAPLMAHE